jgi:hypothetical protein
VLIANQSYRRAFLYLEFAMQPDGVTSPPVASLSLNCFIPSAFAVEALGRFTSKLYLIAN